jgi:hypothetical protein
MPPKVSEKKLCPLRQSLAQHSCGGLCNLTSTSSTSSKTCAARGGKAKRTQSSVTLVKRSGCFQPQVIVERKIARQLQTTSYHTTSSHHITIMTDNGGSSSGISGNPASSKNNNSSSSTPAFALDEQPTISVAVKNFFAEKLAQQFAAATVLQQCCRHLLLTINAAELMTPVQYGEWKPQVSGRVVHLFVFCVVS